MAEVRLEATKRDRTGKGAARKARSAGKVPATLYGHGIDPASIEVNRRDLISAFHTEAGTNVLLDLQLDGSTTLAIARELQRDPVKGTLLHADFVKVDRTQEIEAEVPVRVIGESPGAKEGGIVEQPLFSVVVKATVTNVPDGVDADVSSLGMGDSLRVSELSKTDDFEIVNDPDEVVVTIATPVSEEELEAMEAEAGVELEAPEAEEAEEAGEAEAAPEEEEGEEEGE
jgi:large subunit ribosomal protein L25